MDYKGLKRESDLHRSWSTEVERVRDTLMRNENTNTHHKTSFFAGKYR